MNSITNIMPAASLRTTQGKVALAERQSLPAPSKEQVEGAEEIQQAFTKFVGTTVFGQMMSSMRQTVGKPAYFHGGQAEEVFRGQLDQQLAEEMTKNGASPFAQGMFEQQFPNQADILRRHTQVEKTEKADGGEWDRLSALPQR